MVKRKTLFVKDLSLNSISSHIRKATIKRILDLFDIIIIDLIIIS